MTDDLIKYLIGDVNVNYSISDFTVSYYKPDVYFDITCDIYVQINGRDNWWDKQVHTVLNDIRINSYPYTKYVYLTESDVVFSDDEMTTKLNVFDQTFCLPLGKVVVQGATQDGTYKLSIDTEDPLFSQVIAGKEVTPDMFEKTTEDLTLIPEAIGDLNLKIGDVSELKTSEKFNIVSAINEIVSEIEEIKKSTAASINSIGDGLKITDGTLSIDCASVSDTENAVNEIID